MTHNRRVFGIAITGDTCEIRADIQGITERSPAQETEYQRQRAEYQRQQAEHRRKQAEHQRELALQEREREQAERERQRARGRGPR